MVKKKVKTFLVLSVSALVLINLLFVSAAILSQKYGSVTLTPGEKYTLNIPFLRIGQQTTICGTAQETDGTLLTGVKVVAEQLPSGINSTNITNSNGEYCITVPEIDGSSDVFNIYIEYENIDGADTLTLGSNDYDLNFEDNKVYSKTTDDYARLTGNITNEDAIIENGRFEFKVGYKEDGSWDGNYFTTNYPYKYHLNINAKEVYSLPNANIDMIWEIPEDAPIGEYRFLYKTSFNGNEKTSQYVYFNLTE